MEKTRNDDVIDLGQILLALRKRLGLIILAGLVVAFGAALYTRFLMTPGVYFFIDYAGADKRNYIGVGGGSSARYSADERLLGID